MRDKYHGRYVILEVEAAGLVIRITEEGEIYLGGIWNEGENTFKTPYALLWAELLEDIICNSSVNILTGQIGLTDAPIIGMNVNYADDGQLETTGDIFYFDNYMLENEVQTLFQKGQVRFLKVEITVEENARVRELDRLVQAEAAKPNQGDPFIGLTLLAARKAASFSERGQQVFIDGLEAILLVMDERLSYPGPEYMSDESVRRLNSMAVALNQSLGQHDKFLAYGLLTILNAVKYGRTQQYIHLLNVVRREIERDLEYAEKILAAQGNEPDLMWPNVIDDTKVH